MSVSWVLRGKEGIDVMRRMGRVERAVRRRKGDERGVHWNTVPMHRRLEWRRHSTERRMLSRTVCRERRRRVRLEPVCSVDGGAPAPAPCRRAGERRPCVEGVVVVGQRAPESVVRRAWVREWLRWR